MSRNAPLFATALLTLLSACARPSVTPLQIQTQSPLSAIAAEFETTIVETNTNDNVQAEQHYRWRFYRSANRIETHKLHDDSSEIWTKSANGDIVYQRTFHPQKQVIEYLPGDLKAIGVQLDWLVLATLIPPDLMADLITDGQENFLGRSAIRYVSQNTEQVTEMLWLDAEQIPGMIQRQQHGHLLITRLTAIYPMAQSPWLPPDSTNYRIIDFADLGDKESDPFIQSILPKLKGGHSHGY